MAHEISEARLMTLLTRARAYAEWPHVIQDRNILGATNDEMLALVEMTGCELRRRIKARAAQEDTTHDRP